MTRARTLGSLLLVPLSLCARAARAADVGLLDPRPVFVSTVSASEKESINKQIPPNKEFALTDKSLTRSAVGSGYTLIPLPAFVYNRNEGAWIGGLTPVFRANEKGQVEDIYAPLYMHNDLIGETLTFSYFGYRSGTRQYHAILSYATKVERTVDFSYKDTGFGDGSYIVGLQANSGKSAFNRFYGFGQGSSVDAESNYALGDANLVGSGGINLSDELSLVATERLRRVTIGNGVVSRLPQTPAAFPTAPGIEGAKIWGQGLTLTYDTRDNPLTPLEGSFAMVMAESDQNYQSDNRNQWWRTTVEAKNFRRTPTIGRSWSLTRSSISCPSTAKAWCVRASLSMNVRRWAGRPLCAVTDAAVSSAATRCCSTSRNASRSSKGPSWATWWSCASRLSWTWGGWGGSSATTGS